MESYTKIKEMFLMQQRLNDETNGAGWEDGYTKNGKLINWKRCIYMECAELIDSYILEQNYKIKDLNSIVSEIIAVSGYGEFSSYAYSIDEYSIYEIINDIEIIIHQTSGFDIDIHDLLTNYFRVALKCGVSLDILFEKYIGKNVLNKFRQDHGYKEGSYRKIWGGKEDNEVLLEILAGGAVSVGEIYAKLDKIYGAAN